MDNLLKKLQNANEEVEIQDLGRTIVASNIPKNIDPYNQLQYCDNVEHEGGGQFRFDGVYPESKKELITILKGGVKESELTKKQKKLIESLWLPIFKRLSESEREGWTRETSNLYQHALCELKRAGVDKDIYGEMLPNAVLEIVEMFAKQGHSGMSAAYSLQLLTKLLQFENLTPIGNTPDEWMEVSEEMMGRKGVWQCRRNPALFSEDAGKTYYHVDDKTKVMTSEHVS